MTHERTEQEAGAAAARAYAYAKAKRWFLRPGKCADYPDVAARLFTPGGADWPRVRLAVCGSEAVGYSLKAWLKMADDPDVGWEAIPLPWGLLGAAGRLVQTTVGDAANLRRAAPVRARAVA